MLVLLGLVVGFFAGLLGIGGGAIMVPALTAYFLWQGVNDSMVVHLALATSMSCIIFNALLSIRAHQKHSAIIWPIVITISPAVLLGSALATFFVIKMSSKTIALIFMVLMLLIAAQMIFDFKPKSTASKTLGAAKLLPAGFIIGLVSAVLAIGGGSLTVPYLAWHQVNFKKAIASAAAIGLPIALAGCLVFIAKGFNNTKIPENTLGYIYWPATLFITLGSVFSTAVGANLTHKLPIKPLKIIFAILIITLALKMYLTF